MNKEKQIEEMANITCLCNACGICECDGEPCDLDCSEGKAMERLYNAGYRKASEVAREIFEEIDTVFDEIIDEATDQLASARLECDLKAVKTMEYGIDVIRLVYRTLKKSLKKKYTESEDTE